MHFLIYSYNEQKKKPLAKYHHLQRCLHTAWRLWKRRHGDLSIQHWTIMQQQQWQQRYLKEKVLSLWRQYTLQVRQKNQRQFVAKFYAKSRQLNATWKRWSGATKRRQAKRQQWRLAIMNHHRNSLQYFWLVMVKNFQKSRWLSQQLEIVIQRRRRKSLIRWKKAYKNKLFWRQTDIFVKV